MWCVCVWGGCSELQLQADLGQGVVNARCHVSTRPTEKAGLKSASCQDSQIQSTIRAVRSKFGFLQFVNDKIIIIFIYKVLNHN